MTGRDYCLGDTVDYQASKRGVKPWRWAQGKVEGFRVASNSAKLGGLVRGRKAEGFVEVRGQDGFVRSFRRSQLRLVRRFDQ